MTSEKTINCIEYIDSLSENDLKHTLRDLYREYASKVPVAVSFTTFYGLVRRQRETNSLPATDKCTCKPSAVRACPYCAQRQRELFNDFIGDLKLTNKSLRPSITRQSHAFNQLLATHGVKPLSYQMYRKWLIANEAERKS